MFTVKNPQSEFPFAMYSCAVAAIANACEIALVFAIDTYVYDDYARIVWASKE